MTLKTEQELFDLVDSQFPDNTQGLISAQRLRDFLKSEISSQRIQRTKVVDMTVDPYVLTEAGVNENVIHVTSGSDRIVQLPSAAAVEGQSAIVLATDNSLVNVQAADPIIGDANFTEPVLVRYRSFNGEWVGLPLYLSRKDTVEIAIMFNEPGTLSAGEEMRLGNTEGQNNQGWVAPFSGTLNRVSISRGNSALADIDISINGVVEETVITSADKSVHEVSVAVAEGDSVMVLGGASTPNTLTQPVVVMILRKSDT